MSNPEDCVDLTEDASNQDEGGMEFTEEWDVVDETLNSDADDDDQPEVVGDVKVTSNKPQEDKTKHSEEESPNSQRRVTRAAAGRKMTTRSSTSAVTEPTQSENVEVDKEVAHTSSDVVSGTENIKSKTPVTARGRRRVSRGGGKNQAATSGANETTEDKSNVSNNAEIAVGTEVMETGITVSLEPVKIKEEKIETSEDDVEKTILPESDTPMAVDSVTQNTTEKVKENTLKVESNKTSEEKSVAADKEVIVIDSNSEREITGKNIINTNSKTTAGKDAESKTKSADNVKAAVGKPTTMTGKPATTTGKPATTTGKPATTTGKPTTMTGKPLTTGTTTGKPVTTGTKTAPIQKAPVQQQVELQFGNHAILKKAPVAVVLPKLEIKDLTKENVLMAFRHSQSFHVDFPNRPQKTGSANITYWLSNVNRQKIICKILAKLRSCGVMLECPKLIQGMIRSFETNRERAMTASGNAPSKLQSASSVQSARNAPTASKIQPASKTSPAKNNQPPSKSPSANQAVSKGKVGEAKTNPQSTQGVTPKERSMFVENIPQNVHEKRLRKLFPSAKRACLPKNAGSSHMGWAVMEFRTRAAMLDAIDKNKNLTINNCKIKLSQIRKGNDRRIPNTPMMRLWLWGIKPGDKGNFFTNQLGRRLNKLKLMNRFKFGQNRRLGNPGIGNLNPGPIVGGSNMGRNMGFRVPNMTNAMIGPNMGSVLGAPNVNLGMGGRNFGMGLNMGQNFGQNMRGNQNRPMQSPGSGGGRDRSFQDRKRFGSQSSDGERRFSLDRSSRSIDRELEMIRNQDFSRSRFDDERDLMRSLSRERELQMFNRDDTAGRRRRESDRSRSFDRGNDREFDTDYMQDFNRRNALGMGDRARSRERADRSHNDRQNRRQRKLSTEMVNSPESDYDTGYRRKKDNSNFEKSLSEKLGVVLSNERHGVQDDKAMVLLLQTALNAMQKPSRSRSPEHSPQRSRPACKQSPSPRRQTGGKNKRKNPFGDKSAQDKRQQREGANVDSTQGGRWKSPVFDNFQGGMGSSNVTGTSQTGFGRGGTSQTGLGRGGTSQTGLGRGGTPQTGLGRGGTPQTGLGSGGRKKRRIRWTQNKNNKKNKTSQNFGGTGNTGSGGGTKFQNQGSALPKQSDTYQPSVSTASTSYPSLSSMPTLSQENQNRASDYGFTTYNQPNQAYSPQNQSYTRPNPAYTRPDDAYTRPDDAYTRPDDAYTRPDDVYSRPNDSYSRPNDAYSRPNDSYSRPNDAYSRPNDAYSRPNDAYSRPNDAYSGPNDSYSRLNQAYTPPVPVYTPPNPTYSQPLFPAATQSYQQSTRDYYSGSRF